MKTFSRNPDGEGMFHMAGPTAATRAARRGTFSLDTADPVVAGSPVRLAFRFVCGERALEQGDTLGLAWRLPCDWGDLQFEDPKAPNFAKAHTPESVGLQLTYQSRGGIKPWHHLFTATLTHGRLTCAEQIRFVLGDRSGGSVGWTCQRSIASGHLFMGMVKPHSERHWLELPGMDVLEVASGTAASLSIVAPSDGRCGEPLQLIVRLDDAYGNPSSGAPDDVRLDADGLEVSSIERIQRDGRPIDVWKATVVLQRPGRYRVKAWASVLGLEAESNPIDCSARAYPEQLLWGDLHAGQSDLGCGQGSLEEFFWYAQHVAGLQFASHQPNDVYLTRDDWHHARTVTEDVHDPGRGFVAFHGCEWTALPSSGGDRNVVYRSDQPLLHRASRWYQEEHPDSWKDANDPDELYACLSGTEALINLHAGGFTSELAWLDPRLEGLVEIHSTHGTSDWLVEKAMDQGRTFGISAGTDGIAGRPGACVPGSRQTRNLPNGCFGVYARSGTREDIWRGIASRRCYGTDGKRIRLAVKLGEAFMGEELTTDALPPLIVDVAGTAAIERVIVRRNSAVVGTRELWDADPEHPHRYRLHWCGTRSHGSSNAQALAWTGRLRSSAGSLELVSAFGFYCEEDALTPDGDGISFRSTTAGNVAGFLFDAPAGRDGRLRLDSNLIATDLPWPQNSALRYPLMPEMGTGYVGLSRAPAENGARDHHLEMHLEHASLAGKHAYWVEVVQIDGRRAWSSPVFVTFA